MSSIIDQLIDEELQITQHPNKDMIISAIGNPDFLITFSDVNKVGINPRTNGISTKRQLMEPRETRFLHQAENTGT
jgi:hypothetical protein